MEKIVTEHSGKVIKEYYSSAKILIIVGLITAVAIIALYIVFGFIYNEWSSPMNITLAVMGGLVLIADGLYLFRIINAVKIANNNITIYHSEFLADYITVSGYRDNKKIGETKLFYKDLTDFQESKNYLYLRQNKSIVMVVNKVDGLIELLESHDLRRVKIGKNK